MSEVRSDASEVVVALIKSTNFDEIILFERVDEEDAKCELFFHFKK